MAGARAVYAVRAGRGGGVITSVVSAAPSFNMTGGNYQQGPGIALLAGNSPK